MNPEGNPDIADYGMATRFGQPNGVNAAVASHSGKPWSIRNAMRYLAAQEVEGEDENAFKPKGKMTRAMRIAMKAMAKADNGDMRAISYVTENIEGKLLQPVQELPLPKKYNYDDMTDEEALAAYDELCRK
jgi:hypothetical protein